MRANSTYLFTYFYKRCWPRQTSRKTKQTTKYQYVKNYQDNGAVHMPATISVRPPTLVCKEEEKFKSQRKLI